VSDSTGKIGWIDMSVDQADEVRDFYKAGAVAALYQP
jgi:hypothetical protein